MPYGHLLSSHYGNSKECTSILKNHQELQGEYNIFSVCLLKKSSSHRTNVACKMSSYSWECFCIKFKFIFT